MFSPTPDTPALQLPGPPSKGKSQTFVNPIRAKRKKQAQGAEERTLIQGRLVSELKKLWSLLPCPRRESPGFPIDCSMGIGTCRIETVKGQGPQLILGLLDSKREQ